jgi:prevent-host-death family protein
MDSISHREMRNQSGEILRRVAAGESIQVTNNGRVAAVIVPPPSSMLESLVERGEVRLATGDLSDLRAMDRHESELTTKEILDDLRGQS